MIGYIVNIPKPPQKRTLVTIVKVMYMGFAEDVYMICDSS